MTNHEMTKNNLLDEGWRQITVRDTISNLQFAIDQLKKTGKEHCIVLEGKYKISIWTKDGKIKNARIS